MHSAPSVSFPVGQSRLANRLLWVVWTSGALCTGVVGFGLDGFDSWRSLVLGAAVLLAGAVVVRDRRHDSAGGLCFDGQHWSPSGTSSMGTGRAQVCLDLQVLMLLRITASDRPQRWLWVDRNADARHWRDLRRAAYSLAPVASDAREPRAELAAHDGRRPLS